VVIANKSINLSGGWDPSFTSQNGYSTINGEQIRIGMTVIHANTVFMDHFIIQNGLGGGIYNMEVLTAEEFSDSMEAYRYRIPFWPKIMPPHALIAAVAFLQMVTTCLGISQAVHFQLRVEIWSMLMHR
jgi:hypothetical protein